MNLVKPLEFAEATIEDLSFTPTDKDPKAVLLLRTPLTLEIAGLLGVGWVFVEGTTPHANLGSFPIDNTILRDVVLQLPGAGGFDSYFPELVHKFRVEKCSETELDLLCRIHITDKFDDLVAFLRAVNKDTFAASIRPRQGDLFEEGTRVDMAPAPAAAEQTGADGNCVLCADGIPLDDDGVTHTTKVGRRKLQVKCTNFGPPRPDPSGDAATA